MKGFDSHPYIPDSVPEVQAEMLREIGVESLDDLHKNVPELLKLKERYNIYYTVHIDESLDPCSVNPRIAIPFFINSNCCCVVCIF